METKQYVILRDTTYYGGDCQHPQGWTLRVEEMEGMDCIGTLEECQDWLEELNDGPTYLSHGEAGISYRIAEAVDDNCDYQSWLDGVNWEGCPSEDGNDYNANCAWAEDQAYNNDGVLPVPCNNGSGLLLVDLTVEACNHENNL